LKYKKEDSSLGIVSINPINIIGSKEVWCYNTKTRKISQYKALDVDGISVKGGSLLNYSPDSVEKTVRKPAETLAEFKKASKVKLRTFMKDLTTVDIPAGGKLNEHHVILRIDK
jgi:ABC-type hemin transport system substrate-binding protein